VHQRDIDAVVSSIVAIQAEGPDWQQKALLHTRWVSNGEENILAGRWVSGSGNSEIWWVPVMDRGQLVTVRVWFDRHAMPVEPYGNDDVVFILPPRPWEEDEDRRAAIGTAKDHFMAILSGSSHLPRKEDYLQEINRVSWEFCPRSTTAEG
jgi:hypothetical protein